jgi:hypothetical protein
MPSGNYVSQPLLTMYRRDGFRDERRVSFVAYWDRQQLAKRERQRMRGEGPYAAPEPRLTVSPRQMVEIDQRMKVRRK